MSIGKRLRRARENKKLSQLEVSEKTNINNKTLSRYENDGAEPDYDTLKTLAKLYGVSLSYFFGETEKEVYDLEELLKDKKITWGNEELNEEEKRMFVSQFIRKIEFKLIDQPPKDKRNKKGKSLVVITNVEFY